MYQLAVRVKRGAARLASRRTSAQTLCQNERGEVELQGQLKYVKGCTYARAPDPTSLDEINQTEPLFLQGRRFQRGPSRLLEQMLRLRFRFLISCATRFLQHWRAVQTSTLQIVTFVWLILSRVVQLISDAIDSDSINHCLQFIPISAQQ